MHVLATLKNITDADGFEIALVGMVIVFCALTIISLIIAALPKILDLLEPILPAPAQHGHHGASSHAPAASTANAEGETVAAIAAALHHQRNLR